MTDTSADDQAALLKRWVAALVAELSASTAPADARRAEAEPSVDRDGLDGFAFDADFDIDAVLALAGVAAHSVVRPAAPLTTYVVGYAAGLAVATGTDPAVALQQATAAATAAAHRWRAEQGG